MNLKPIDLATASHILDFTGGDPAMANLGQIQLEGAVALHNMIADPGVGMGYLADEVGMGKTYVALGVVALMRYFNPSLRVLYICPSNNVQDKWYAREYRAFCKNNVKVNQYRIRTVDGKPASPRINCRNVRDLIHNASTGYYADFFVGMGSFSIALSEDEDHWWKALKELQTLLPAHTLPKYIRSKTSVKDQYAAALNYVLPTFDLVVIDEAHKFKHDFDSSDRNRVLSAVLGFRNDGSSKLRTRAKHALLLSATPYDRNLNHLRNQLRLVGREFLLPADIEDDDHKLVETHLSKFLVRRLNELQIAGEPHTRNMYRKEWRRGDNAEITLESDEQKLVTALVQKKVGEMLDRQSSSPSFQTGLLASFESFAESTRSEPVEFDGDINEKDTSDAKDRHVVGVIADTYIQADLGRSLPHPKMDIVSSRLAEALFHRGRKQIVFVRRVKSVRELKNKLDDHYTDWLASYIRSQLDGYPDALRVMEAVIDEYLHRSRERDDDISGGVFVAGDTGDAEDTQQAKTDTLFSWFFRGMPPDDCESLLHTQDDSFTTPDAMRNGLAAKNQIISALLEVNWAKVFARALGLNLTEILNAHAEHIASLASAYTIGQIQNDQLEIYSASQLGFLEWLVNESRLPSAQLLIDHYRPTEPVRREVDIPAQRLKEALTTQTLFCSLEEYDLLESLFPPLIKVRDAIVGGEELEPDSLQVLDVHQNMLSLSIRTGHGVVDVYLSRLRQGTENLTVATRAAWIDDFTSVLKKQSTEKQFNTWQELHNLAENFELIVKNNLPDVFDRPRDEYRIYLARTLNPVAPIIGATGETVSTRSAQARKFRMPGYPLALISTDVFQEGEDLHTFCDSVMHYGLSGSPVSIEQKTGRVDRVGSMAQRRLLTYASKDNINDQSYIQVAFPFVRESIEVLQVRNLCENINRFIESLHEISSKPVDAEDTIAMDLALLDRSPIPDQILDRLKSPYIPAPRPTSAKTNRTAFVDEQGRHTARIVSHIDQLLTAKFGSAVLGKEGVRMQRGDTREHSMSVTLKSARSSGEILLCATTPAEKITTCDRSHRWLCDIMVRESWRTFHRTYGVYTATNELFLHHDAELLVGDKGTTTPSEIDMFFERFQHGHDPSDYGKPSAAQTRKYWERARNDKSAHFGQWNAQISCFEKRGHLGLQFRFKDPQNDRKHNIRIYEVEGRCVFLAQAATPKVTQALTVDQLLRLTWVRNRDIDLVEFMLDDEMSIYGRVIHPIDGMTYREFLYCAYTLAASTDRLEFLLREEDVH
ncbi:putative helicase [gamma proteobacterium NOR5-3]|nr:putative helicase [gamma proteobacterium NOR5-3]